MGKTLGDRGESQGRHGGGRREREREREAGRQSENNQCLLFIRFTKKKKKILALLHPMMSDITYGNLLRYSY